MLNQAWSVDCMVHGQQLISSADEGCCVQSKISGMKLILSLNKDESINNNQNVQARSVYL